MEVAVEPSSSQHISPIEIIECSSSSDTSSNKKDTENKKENKKETSLRYDEEEDDEDICRICRSAGDKENPLRYPCACNGSIKFVHQDCLLQWLKHSNARQCEVCKHPFSFFSVYAENAPTRLSFQEFVVGIAMKACQLLRFVLRLAVVCSVWLIIFPSITFWTWRLSFLRSFSEVHGLLLRRVSTTVVLTDYLLGFLFSASTIFIFLGATYLRDYFRHRRENGGQDVQGDDEGDRNGARAARRPPAPANGLPDGDGNGEHVDGGQGIAGAGQIIRRNAENVAARLEQMLDGLDDPDGEEDVQFAELVGLQGPVFNLVENAFTVLVSNLIFLALVVFVPFSFGRIVFHYLSWIFFAVTSFLLSAVLPLTESAFSLAYKTLKNPMDHDHVMEVVAETFKANTTVSNSISSPLATDNSKIMVSGISWFSNITTLAVGYMFLLSLVGLYLEFTAVIRYTRGEPFPMRRLYVFTSIAGAILSLVRRFMAAVRHLMNVIKVAFLLVVKLGLVPLLCGWWLDVCTMKMLGSTVPQRLLFFSSSPVACSLLHWVVGFAYMLQISIFMRLLRGVLRNGVLYFLRDPTHPNRRPLRDLVDHPVHKHARRVILSAAAYASLTVLLVYLPVKLAMRLTPAVFPLDLSVSDPFTEVPANMLLLQICIRFAKRHIELRATIKALLQQWFTAVGWTLGLTDFLLAKPEDTGVARAAEAQNRAMPITGHADGTEESDVEEKSDLKHGFILRIAVLLILAWTTLLLFNTAVFVFPISLGRALFIAIPLLPIFHGIKCNDLHAFFLGSYMIWATLAATRYCIRHVRTLRAGILFQRIQKLSANLFRHFSTFIICVFVIPLLIGLLVELLVIVPIRVPINESPVFLLYQDWALGNILFKIWIKLIILDNNMIPLADEAWRNEFVRARNGEYNRLQWLRMMQVIVNPVVMKLLTALCVPYVLARGVFPVFGYSLLVNSAVYRFAWVGCMSFIFGYLCAKRIHFWLVNLHNTIRDDLYLIGRRLHNFGEDTRSS